MYGHCGRGGGGGGHGRASVIFRKLATALKATKKNGVVFTAANVRRTRTNSQLRAKRSDSFFISFRKNKKKFFFLKNLKIGTRRFQNVIDTFTRRFERFNSNDDVYVNSVLDGSTAKIMSRRKSIKNLW